MGIFNSKERITKAFHEASINGDVEKVTKLLSRKGDIDVKALNEKCTLHSAVSFRFTEIVKILLKIGCHVNGLNWLGNTPLNWAVGFESNLPVVQILLENGANIDARDSEDKTALYKACQYQKHEIVQELLKHNPEIDAVSKASHGTTPLQAAAFEGNVKIFEKLMKHGANIDHLDFSKTSVLTYAVFRSNVHIVKKLLKHGCKKNIRETSFELTEIEAALEVESYDTFKMLAFHER